MILLRKPEIKIGITLVIPMIQTRRNDLLFASIGTWQLSRGEVMILQTT